MSINQQLGAHGDQCSAMMRSSRKGWLECFSEVQDKRRDAWARLDAVYNGNSEQYRRAVNQCYAVADQNARSQREAEDSRRTQELNSNRQRQQATRDFEQQRAQYEREQARQPRIVGDLKPSPYSPTTRNEPRQVALPSNPVSTAAAQSFNRNEQLREQGQALRGVAQSLVEGFRGSGVPAETNVAANALRNSPVSTAIGSASLTAAGAKAAESRSNVERAVREMESVTGASNTTNPLIRPGAVNPWASNAQAVNVATVAPRVQQEPQKANEGRQPANSSSNPWADPVPTQVGKSVSDSEKTALADLACAKAASFKYKWRGTSAGEFCYSERGPKLAPVTCCPK